MKKENIKYLNWAFNLITIDLKKLSFYDWFHEMAMAFLYSVNLNDLFTEAPLNTSPYTIKETVNMLKSHEDGNYYITGLEGRKLLSAQCKIKQVLLSVISNNYDQLLLKIAPYSEIFTVAIKDDQQKERSMFSTGFHVPNFEDALIVRLLRSIDGLSTDSIKECPECNRWFAHVTRVRKIYCSNKCASCHITRRNRKK